MLLREKAYNGFKSHLFANKLKPGQFISQRELSEILDVPLNPVREALQRLEVTGLIKIVAQRGFQIIEPTPQMVKESYELRMMLEMAAIKMFPVEKLKDGLLDIKAKTEGLYKAVEAPLKPEKIKSLLDVDWCLHEYLITSLENDTIFQVYRSNADKVRVARLKQRFTVDQLKQVLDEHTAIIEALLSNEIEAAARFLEKHLRISLERGLGITSFLHR